MKQDQTHIEQVRERLADAERALGQCQREVFAVQQELDALVEAEDAKRPANSNQLEIRAFIKQQMKVREEQALQAQLLRESGLTGPPRSPIDEQLARRKRQ